MARSRGRRFVRGRRSSRSSHWHPFLWQAFNQVIRVAAGESYWASFWARYPSGEVDPLSEQITPSDETLVRYIGQLVVAWDAISTSFESPVSIVAGLIAFDGGTYPEFYENSLFQEGTSLVAPPSPVLEADDDWIIRIPMQFPADGSYQGPGDRIFIESRAMRKLPPGTGILAVIHPYTVLEPTVELPTLNWSWDGRLLVKSGYTSGG